MSVSLKETLKELLRNEAPTVFFHCLLDAVKEVKAEESGWISRPCGRFTLLNHWLGALNKGWNESP